MALRDDGGVRQLEHCRFRRLSERLAEWTVPPGEAGARFEGREAFLGGIVTPVGEPYVLDIDPGEERTELRPTGSGLLPRGPNSTEAGELLSFAIDTCAAECLGPLSALHPGTYLLVRSPLRPRAGPVAYWGNSCETPPGHYRDLHRPRHRAPAPAKRYGSSGKVKPALTPQPRRSTIRAAIVGGRPGQAPCVRQPLVGLVVQDYDLVGFGHGVFLTALAEPSGRDPPNEDLLIVLPITGPWVTSPWVGVLGDSLDIGWPQRVRELGASMTFGQEE
jgi:hypothetical protein